MVAIMVTGMDMDMGMETDKQTQGPPQHEISSWNAGEKEIGMSCQD